MVDPALDITGFFIVVMFSFYEFFCKACSVSLEKRHSRLYKKYVLLHMSTYRFSTREEGRNRPAPYRPLVLRSNQTNHTRLKQHKGDGRALYGSLCDKVCVCRETVRFKDTYYLQGAGPGF